MEQQPSGAQITQPPLQSSSSTADNIVPKAEPLDSVPGDVRSSEEGLENPQPTKERAQLAVTNAQATNSKGGKVQSNETDVQLQLDDKQSPKNEVQTTDDEVQPEIASVPPKTDDVMQLPKAETGDDLETHDKDDQKVSKDNEALFSGVFSVEERHSLGK